MALHKPYKIYERKWFEIGVYGLGIQLDGWSPKKLYKRNPIP